MAVEVRIPSKTVVEEVVAVIVGVPASYPYTAEHSGNKQASTEQDPTGISRSAIEGAGREEGGTTPYRDRKSAEAAQNKGDSRAPLHKRVRNYMKLLGLQGCDRKQKGREALSM